MGWSTTLISPPDGDVADFLASCARLRARADRLYLPAHGPRDRPARHASTGSSPTAPSREAEVPQPLSRVRPGPMTIAPRDLPRHPGALLNAATRKCPRPSHRTCTKGVLRPPPPPRPSDDGVVAPRLTGSGQRPESPPPPLDGIERHCYTRTRRGGVAQR